MATPIPGGGHKIEVQREPFEGARFRIDTPGDFPSFWCKDEIDRDAIVQGIIDTKGRHRLRQYPITVLEGQA